MITDSADTFWYDHLPTFHAYDYGQDVELESHRGTDRQRTHCIAEQLESLYNIINADAFSCALATNLSCNREEEDIPLLGNREAIEEQYPTRADRCGFTFYPLGLSPRTGNFQARKPPKLLMSEVFEPIIERTKAANGGDVVLPGAMQGYSLIKQVVRHSPADFLLNKGFFQVSLCLSASRASKRNLNQKNKIVKWVNLKATPANRPLTREVKRLGEAIEQKKFGYRMEVIINFRIADMAPDNRSFNYIVQQGLNPLMQFWRSKTREHSPLLLCFEPKV